LYTVQKTVRTVRRTVNCVPAPGQTISQLSFLNVHLRVCTGNCLLIHLVRSVHGRPQVVLLFCLIRSAIITRNSSHILFMHSIKTKNYCQYVWKQFFGIELFTYQIKKKPVNNRLHALEEGPAFVGTNLASLMTRRPLCSFAVSRVPVF
jgi:hypothetical protein